MKSSSKAIAKINDSNTTEVVINVKSAQFIRGFKENPLKTLAEIGLGLWEGGKIEGVKSIGRSLQAARAGQGVAQVLSEFRKFQEKGAIKTDEEIAKDPYAIKSLVDLLNIIDNNPEEDRLEAIKALFFFLLKKDKSDEQEMIAYELFEISKKLSSSELVTLKAAKELAPKLLEERRTSTNQNPSITLKQWCIRIAKELGHPFAELVRRDVEKLGELFLIPEAVTKSSVMDPINYKPSELGLALCDAIESYRKDLT